MPHGAAYYTAFSVLKNYLDAGGYSIQNFSLQEQAPDRVEIWVEENAQNAVKFVCVKMSCTQFILWGYDSAGGEIIHTSFNYSIPTV